MHVEFCRVRIKTVFKFSKLIVSLEQTKFRTLLWQAPQNSVLKILTLRVPGT